MTAKVRRRSASADKPLVVVVTATDPLSVESGPSVSDWTVESEGTVESDGVVNEEPLEVGVGAGDVPVRGQVESAAAQQRKDTRRPECNSHCGVTLGERSLIIHVCVCSNTQPFVSCEELH